MAKKKKFGWKLWAGVAAAATAVWYLGRPKPKKKPTGNGNGGTSRPPPTEPPPEADYEPASNPDQHCGNCYYAQPISQPPPPGGMTQNQTFSAAPRVHCALWKVDVYANYTCNRWRSDEKPGGVTF